MIPTARRLLVPGLSTLAMLAVLVVLGTWQMNRLAWKRDLLAALDAAEQRPPAPLAPDSRMLARVTVEGRFADSTGLYGAEVRGPAGGAHLLAVLLRDGAAPVLVDRGWVPVLSSSVPPPPPVPAGPARVEGYLRPPEPPGLFTPAPDLAARRFYALDPGAIGRALGHPDVSPFVLVATGPPGLPDPARTLPRPANNHLSYALTWYGLAAILVVIFALHARKVLRP